MHLLLSSFLLLSGIQIIYMSLYLYSFLKEQSRTETAPVPVTIIVCAHDEEQNVKELVPLLLNQDYPDFEVIIVEDRSNDGTYEFLYNYSHPRLRMVRVNDKPEHVAGKKFALTLGVKAARFEWLVFTDADCRPQGDQWLKTMSKQFTSETQLVVGYSPYQKTAGILNSLIRYEALLTAIQYIGMTLMGRPYMGVGRNLAYRKSLFLNNKGFSTHIGIVGGDDDLFVNQTGTGANVKTCVGESSLVFSAPKKSWSEYYVQKIRHLAVGKYYKFSDKVVLGLFNASWIGTWLLLAPALLFSTFTYLVLTAFLLRVILLMGVSLASSRKLGDPFETWKVPFLDFILAIYYLVTGLVALQTNKIRWKKT